MSSGLSPSQLRKAAERLVRSAVRSGILVSLTDTEVKCVDCGARATCWDHRDYAKPLDVSAVCQGCNNRRGPGLPLPLPHERDHTHALGGSAGLRWSGVEGGESSAHAWPGECFLVVDVESPMVGTNEPVSWGKSSLRFNSTAADRSTFFKKHDPWAVDDTVLG